MNKFFIFSVVSLVGLVGCGSDTPTQEPVVDEPEVLECLDLAEAIRYNEEFIEYNDLSLAYLDELDVGGAARMTRKAGEVLSKSADAVEADPDIHRAIQRASEEYDVAADLMEEAEAALPDYTLATTFVQMATTHLEAASGYVDDATAATKVTDVEPCE